MTEFEKAENSVRYVEAVTKQFGTVWNTEEMKEHLHRMTQLAHKSLYPETKQVSEAHLAYQELKEYGFRINEIRQELLLQLQELLQQAETYQGAFLIFFNENGSPALYQFADKEGLRSIYQLQFPKRNLKNLAIVTCYSAMCQWVRLDYPETKLTSFCAENVLPSQCFNESFINRGIFQQYYFDNLPLLKEKLNSFRIRRCEHCRKMFAVKQQQADSYYNFGMLMPEYCSSCETLMQKEQGYKRIYF